MARVRLVCTLAAVMAASVSISGWTPARTPAVLPRTAAPPVPAEILQNLRRFRMMATVLHVGAHPDDENTQLITALSRGRAVRTAYLSVTRGDGGQNLLGPELGYKLGVARTQELLAARAIDGGRQFFTRALDFGFSKDYQEAFSVWGRDSILSDVVRVVRTFRPDVIITVFSTQPGGTHGHHTGSAVLAVDAFKLAADPKAFPEQLKTLSVWQPRRIFMNTGGGRGASATSGVRMELGGDDPVLGESFASIANRSRRMHKTQGFDQTPQTPPAAGRGGAPATTSRVQGFTLLAGDSASLDIFEGIDTTWARVPGGAKVDGLIGKVIDQFDPLDPSKSVAGLVEIKKIVHGLRRDALVQDKEALLDRIILDCAGVSVRMVAEKVEVIPGDVFRMWQVVAVNSGIPVYRVRVEAPSSPQNYPRNRIRSPYRADSVRVAPILHASTPLTQPYWLKHESTPGMFRVDDPSLIGLPESPSSFPIVHVFWIDGVEVRLADEPRGISPDSTNPALARRLAVVAPVWVRFPQSVGVFQPGQKRTVSVEVVSSVAAPTAVLSLDVPSGWTASPARQTIALTAPIGRPRTYAFEVTAPRASGTATFGASVLFRGKQWNVQRDSVSYPHIPFQLLQPVARYKAVAVDVATRGKMVAYIPGAGDDVPQALEQLGYTVVQIPAPSVTVDTLRRFDAVVIGVRASNVNADLGAAMPALTAYAEGGGVVIEQYNQNGGNLRNTNLGPYPFTIANERVTNENAEVTFLAPEHPVLNTPNKITPKDFEGWVQERGIYFAGQWDDRYTPIFAMNDANEAPLKGSLIVAKVGKGYFAYTGLVFFRELPAGVPGAYRLFANLVSLGKSGIIP